MTYRQNDPSSKGNYSRPQSRLNQQIRSDPTDEGCPVIEESGTVCGETHSLGIFHEFRQMYDDCLKKLEGSESGHDTLRKLAPFKKLIDDLWEQNTMLVETVEELEQEAACRVINLQDRLNKCCQKEVNGMIKAKEREVECLLKKLSEKDDLLKRYCCQIEELKKDLRNKCLKYQEILKHLKAVRAEGNKINEDRAEQEFCDGDDVGEILNAIVKSTEDQIKSVLQELKNAECQIKTLATEKKFYLKERNEITSQMQYLKSENEKLLREIVSQKKMIQERDELLKTVDALKCEKHDLLAKVNNLHGNIQELSNSYKETRWALTSEVAEKHDQVQELKRSVGVLEEQLRQADMQTQFKDDIIKELRKELKALRKSERRGLYDVVNELRERKKECAASGKVSKVPDMNKCQSSVTRSDVGCCSAVGERQERNDDNKTTNENEKFVSQIECLKKSLQMKVEEMKDQEEFMRDLEEELTKTKMDLTALQEKYESQERHNQSGTSPTLKSDFGKTYGTLSCVVNRIEEMLRNLSAKQNCGLLNCRTVLHEEMQKINLIKHDLERGKVKARMNERCNEPTRKESTEESDQSKIKCLYSNNKSSGWCNLLHIDDVEKFKETAVTGLVALERMKEQIDILENLVKNYTEEFPCACDKTLIEQCEEKLGESRREFDNITYQLCRLLQNASKSSTGCNDSLSLDDSVTCKEEERDNNNENCPQEEISRLKSECQRLQKQICDQGNASEKLKRILKQLEEEIQEKQIQLVEHTKEVDSRMCEIYKMREMIRNISNRLKEGQCGCDTQNEEAIVVSPRSMSNLTALFCDLKEFRATLEQSNMCALESSNTLKEENENLKEKLECLERCVCNKEETLRVLQDTVKLRECQIEELTYRMQTSETHSSKLAQDVEEKCRLIANLQDAVRKCKQFEINLELVESLRFEYCELECKLEKFEKDVLIKDQKIERLHHEITDLSSKNLILTQKIKIMNPRFKIMYKTCHLFEKMVNGLQEELNNRECEIEGLYEKIKSLENELDSEFKKYEEKAADDSKCIEQLSLTIKNFQSELFCAQDNYKMSIAETENRFKRELEMRESELNNTISQLKAEISKLKGHAPEVSTRSSPEQYGFDARSQHQMCEKKIEELQDALECIALEHEEEKKNILQMLCEEKKENLKNKSLMTTLNENLQRKIANEKTLEECIDRFTEDLECLKMENQQLACELEARKNIMSSIENERTADLTELEELICSLKIQKAELKGRCCNLKAEMEKEVKLKKTLECRIADLNAMLQTKNQEFNQLVENYKCASMRIQKTQASMKEIEKKLMCSQGNSRPRQDDREEECSRLKILLDAKTAENAQLFCEIQVLKVEAEKIQAENTAARVNKDAAISRLHYEVECLENDLQEFQATCQKLKEENRNLNKQLDCWANKASSLENDFKEKHKDLAAKLRATACEKNDLLKSLVELQKQLEQMCLDAANKEKIKRETSGRKPHSESSDGQAKSKSEKIICNLTKEVKNLHCELITLKEKYGVLNKEYQNLLEEFKCCEKKKCNLEKLYVCVNNENRELAECKMSYERELNELKAQNSLLRDKITNKETFKNSDEKMKLYEKIREITQKVKALENKIIPELQQEISEKICCIENLKIELKEANLSSQRMRNEALRVIQHTRKYLAAQRLANDTLKARLESSNKRGNMLGIENRELEEQLKAVTRMNEYLLCQLESNKSDAGEAEPRSFSPMPWGCSTVERDTSSSEYMAESGFQSMQPSPTNMDYQDPQFDPKRNYSHWGGLKKNKCGGSSEYPCHRNGVR